MAYYDSSGQYITSQATQEARLAAVQAVIAALYVLAADTTADANYSEYFLDDGQTKISTKYRGPGDIANAIAMYQKFETRLLNQLNGYVMRAVDGKNFPGRIC